MSAGPLGLLDVRVLGAVLRAVEAAMRAEDVPEEQTQRVLNMLVYGDRSGPQPDPDAQVAFTPPPVPEDKLVDLMGALEESVKDAKTSRARRKAELKAAYDGLCVAFGCTAPHLTAWDDGNGPLLLCERHGDELAVGGFALKPGAREVSS